MAGVLRLSRRELSLAATACSVQAAELDALCEVTPPVDSKRHGESHARGVEA